MPLDPGQLLRPTFTYREGLAAGLTADELRNPKWDRGFRGLRASRAAQTPAELAHDFAALLRPGEFFSHVTAAVLHGIWLPRHLETDMVLDVANGPGLRQRRGARLRGHLLIPRPGQVGVVDGLPVASLHETWCQLADVLGLEDLVVAGDSVLAKNRRDRLVIARLVEAVAAGDRPRQTLLQRTLPELREHVRSPKETEVRRLLVAAGLPEPRINVDILDATGRRIKESDLVYPEYRVAAEYEGELHLVDPAQQRHDIHLYEELADEGWRVVRVTKDDLRYRRAGVPDRVRAAIEAQRRLGYG